MFGCPVLRISEPGGSAVRLIRTRSVKRQVVSAEFILVVHFAQKVSKVSVVLRCFKTSLCFRSRFARLAEGLLYGTEFQPLTSVYCIITKANNRQSQTTRFDLSNQLSGGFRFKAIRPLKLNQSRMVLHLQRRRFKLRAKI